MTPRPKRTRVERCIYLDRWGYSVIATVRGQQVEKRFPLDTPRDVLRAHLLRARADLDAELQTVGLASARGTLGKDVRTYLERRRGRKGFSADRSHLRAWLAVFERRTRRSLTPHDIEKTLAQWRAEGVAVATIRHRVRVLRELYQALDGKDARHPLRSLALERPARPAPTPIPVALIESVAAKLATLDPQEHARFLIRALTGQRPAQIMRATPADIDTVRKVWYVRPAKGGTPTPFPMDAALEAAWHRFDAVQAWGPFDTSRHAKLLHAAGWPKDRRPYELRHTLAIDLLRARVPLDIIQALLGHASIETTRRFYAPIQAQTLASALALRAPLLTPETTKTLPSSKVISPSKD